MRKTIFFFILLSFFFLNKITLEKTQFSFFTRNIIKNPFRIPNRIKNAEKNIIRYTIAMLDIILRHSFLILLCFSKYYHNENKK